MAEGFIAVKDFETFQHYKGRTPPWIKLYNALLDDYRFLQLPDAARSQLMLIWLVASRHQNRIPNDPKYISQAIHCTTKLWLPRLIQSGWLYIALDAPMQAERKHVASENASKLQAKRSTSAHLEVEVEVEGEKEREIETEKEEDAETAPAPSAIEAMADCFPNRLPAKAMLVGMTQGLGTPGMKAVAVEVLTEAMGELQASGGEITPHRFKAFVRKVLDRANAPANGKAPLSSKPPWQIAKEREERDQMLNKDERVVEAVQFARAKDPDWWNRVTAEAKKAGRWAVPYAFDELEASNART